MTVYKVMFEISVANVWKEDGLTAKVLERRIKEELPGNLVSVSYGYEIFIKKIKARKLKYLKEV